MSNASTAPADATERFPVEIWEFVLEEADSESLLALARTARPLNELALGLYWRRNDIPLSSDCLTLRSHLLRGLFLSCTIQLDVKELRCTFWSSAVGRNILMLRELTHRWANLSEIRLSCMNNLLVYDRLPLQNVIDALKDIVCVVAQRNGSRVALVGAAALLSCDASAIHDWDVALPGAPANSTKMGLFPRLLGQGQLIVVPNAQKKPDNLPRPQSLRLRVGAVHWDVENIVSLHLRAVPRSRGLSLLDLATPSPQLKIVTNEQLSGHDISALLPCLYLPGLSDVEVSASDVDPAELKAFLERHRDLVSVRQVSRLNRTWYGVLYFIGRAVC
ncbi:F-box domain-containing protein [Mycena kentingensis (nom. inval.)]|nr:F-box domain-containing protein [Mycena kentingensis (nom. inval.)]